MELEAKESFEVLTAPGPAALSVVRIDGSGVHAFLASHFSKPVKLGRATHGELRDESGTIDDPLVIVEDDYVELHLHGGSAILQATVELLVGRGFVERVREPASIEESIEESIERDLPRARTRLAVACLLNQPNAWKTQMPSDSPALRRLLDPPTVAIVGVPNAGKSSLANRLFDRQRTIVADVAGTTRDYVSDEANVNGLLVTLLDTPGLRESADAIEQRAIALARFDSRCGFAARAHRREPARAGSTRRDRRSRAAPLESAGGGEQVRHRRARCRGGRARLCGERRRDPRAAVGDV